MTKKEKVEVDTLSEWIKSIADDLKDLISILCNYQNRLATLCHRF